MMMNMGSSGGMGMMDMNMMNMGSMQSGMPMGGNMNGGYYMPGMQHPGQMTGGYNYPGADQLHGAAHGSGSAGNILGSTDFNSLLTGLFNFAINIFAILLVVGLIVGVVVFLKRYLFDGNTPFLSAKTNTTCSCGQVLQAQWNCCPKCGHAKVQQPVTPPTEPQTV